MTLAVTQMVLMLQDAGHVLVFLTGQEQIEQSVQQLKYCLPVYHTYPDSPFCLTPAHSF